LGSPLPPSRLPPGRHAGHDKVVDVDHLKMLTARATTSAIVETATAFVKLT